MGNERTDQEVLAYLQGIRDQANRCETERSEARAESHAMVTLLHYQIAELFVRLGCPMPRPEMTPKGLLNRLWCEADKGTLVYTHDPEALPPGMRPKNGNEQDP